MRVYAIAAMGLVILVASAFSSPVVTLRQYSDISCQGDTVVTASNPIQIVAVTNPDAVQTDMVFTLVYYSPDGATLLGPQLLAYGNLQPAPTYGWILVGDRFYISVHLFNVPQNSQAVDYIGIRFSQVYSGSTDGKHVCFDSSIYGTLDPWSATPGPGIAFDEPRCYKIIAIPNCCGDINNAPASLSGTACWEMSYNFDAQPLSTEMLQFKIVSGPGQINAWTGLWSYTPLATEGGQSLSLVVAACTDVCGDWSYSRCSETSSIPVTVFPGHPPSFSGPDPARFVAQTGVPLNIQLPVSDLDTCTGNHRFSWYTDPGDPVPPATVDTLTGEIVYFGSSADTALYRMHLIVRETDWVDTAEVDIYHFESSTCGDLDHGRTVDVGDLTWMVDYLFFSGMEPVPFASGDVTCDAVVDIGDLSALVEFLFFGGAAPCSGCK